MLRLHQIMATEVVILNSFWPGMSKMLSIKVNAYLHNK